jgi:hypothetical protein
MERSMNRRLTYLAVPLAAAVVGLTSAWVANDPAASRANVAADAAQGARYSILDRPATDDDRVAGWRAAQAPVPAAPDFARSRIVRRDRTMAVAAVPSRTGICLVTQYSNGSGGLACGGPVTVNVGYGEALGIVPDEVRTVTFEMTDGAPRTQAVSGNTFVAPAEARRVVYELAGRTESVDLMPASRLPDGVSIGADGVASGGSAR